MTSDGRVFAPVNEQLERHPFLKADADTRTLGVAPGSWPVRVALVVPPGYRLSVPAVFRSIYEEITRAFEPASRFSNNSTRFRKPTILYVKGVAMVSQRTFSA